MTTSRWTDEYLESMRQVCDPEADKLIADHDAPALRALMDHLVKNDDVVRDAPGVRPEVYAYCTSVVPPTDPRIARGQALFGKYALECVWLLGTASLPMLYACEKGANVLTDTGRLTDDATRRIFETSQFVLDVMAPGGLGPDGRGLRSIQKVRLMHAGIRGLINTKHQADPSWPGWQDAWGKPVNQEDLANTLMSFSVLLLDGLERFGHVIDPEDAEAYVYTWNQIGLRLGVNPDLLPQNRADAEALKDAICAHQWTGGPAGTRLTKTLFDFFEGLIPGDAFDGMTANTTRFVLGNHLGDLLHIPRHPLSAVLMHLVPTVTRIGDAIEQPMESLFQHVFHSHYRGRPVMAYLGLVILQGFLKVERHGNRPPFSIPATLNIDVGDRD